MVMAQKDRNRWVAQKGFEMIDKRLPYRFLPDSTVREPVASRQTEHIHFFGGARPFVGNPNPFERSKGRPITCDEAVRLYGGVLIKEFRK
ncbi:hypothetical protein AtNW77_Chr4g0291231 [Arabidopsis thaliana]|uniref:Uncharacterized protein n=2 Tax=Arabidopsis TaxID=3701 RepID=A0A178USH7_ARATH|nr:hypothetical protein ISN45_At04g016830 [Arabidopsis thaliana x Arabidopsis arenosa]OAO96919.1 hypothetical protein AXX17_AT4G18740 [Arabidopsis thaliana]